MSRSADLKDRSVRHRFPTWDSQAALLANLGSPQIDAIPDHAGKFGVRERAILKYEVVWVGKVA